MNKKDLKIKKLEEENAKLKETLEKNQEFLKKAAERLHFKSLDHLLYTLEHGEIIGYSTANWEGFNENTKR